MANVRIALFTPFNPNAGGGGVIFRSLLPYLQGAEVRWFYLSNSTSSLADTTRLGPSIFGGPLLTDGMASIRLFVAQSDARIDGHLKTILDWSPDIAWVNAMNEGLLVGTRLRDAGVKRLHVSVHDDPAGLAHKSKRYRILAPFIDRCTRALLTRADTVDVVCDAMRTYYSNRFGINSGVVFRYIQELNLPPVEDVDESVVAIGHVGSAYSAPEVFAFLNALRSISQADGIRFRLFNFGISPAMTAAGREFPEMVENAGDVAEPEVVRRLQQCKFLYSMYSFNPRHRVFRETSQPTKMSTYLMAAKPIFVHCPEESSTQAMLERFKLGLCVTTMDTSQIEIGIREILKFHLDRNVVSKAAEFYCGKQNLECLGASLGLSLP